MALERLQANIARYAFPSDFADFLYLTVPAKSTPTTSNAASGFVLSFGRSPGTGDVTAFARNGLHPSTQGGLSSPAL